jgi:hypothetical protein
MKKIKTLFILFIIGISFNLIGKQTLPENFTFVTMPQSFITHGAIGVETMYRGQLTMPSDAKTSPQLYQIWMNVFLPPYDFLNLVPSDNPSDVFIVSAQEPVITKVKGKGYWIIQFKQ